VIDPNKVVIIENKPGAGPVPTVAPTLPPPTVAPTPPPTAPPVTVPPTPPPTVPPVTVPPTPPPTVPPVSAPPTAPPVTVAPTPLPTVPPTPPPASTPATVKPAIENAIKDGQTIFNGLKPQEQQAIVDIARTMINKDVAAANQVQVNNVQDLINQVRTRTDTMAPAAVQSAFRDVEKSLSDVRIARAGYAGAKIADEATSGTGFSLGGADAIADEVASQAGITAAQAKVLLEMQDNQFDKLVKLVNDTKPGLGL
jgi:hypothetical protein